MSTGSLKTDVAVLRTTSDRIDQLAQELHAAANKLDGDMNTLLAAWSGPAALAFTNLKATYAERVNKLNRTLGEIAQGVSANAKSYEQNEQQAESSAQRITATLA